MRTGAAYLTSVRRVGARGERPVGGATGRTRNARARVARQQVGQVASAGAEADGERREVLAEREDGGCVAEQVCALRIRVGARCRAVLRGGRTAGARARPAALRHALQETAPAVIGGRHV